jgi:DNA polymerase (family 10)
MKVPGIGPKKAFRLVGQFGLTDKETVVDDLLNVARANKISTLEGFGKKSQDDIIEALEVHKQKDRREERMPLPFAFSLAEEVSAYLKELPEVKRVDALGSMRRRVSTIGDIDLSVLADLNESQKIVDHFLKYAGKGRLKEQVQPRPQLLQRVIFELTFVFRKKRVTAQCFSILQEVKLITSNSVNMLLRKAIHFLNMV